MTENPLAGRHILCVEDESLVAMLLEDILMDLGCVVVGPFARVPEALEALASQRVDCAVLDVNLRGTRSYPIADALAEKGVPYIFVTGYNEAGIDPAYQEVGVIQKPYSPDTIAAALTDVFQA